MQSARLTAAKPFQPQRRTHAPAASRVRRHAAEVDGRLPAVGEQAAFFQPHPDRAEPHGENPRARQAHDEDMPALVHEHAPQRGRPSPERSQSSQSASTAKKPKVKE